MIEFAPPFPHCFGSSAYRACAIDRDGRALFVVEVEATDDAGAIWLANAFSALHPVTLWQGARFLGRFG